MEVRKSRFEKFSGEEKVKYITRLRKRIEQGYLDSDKILDSIVDKLASCFDEEMSKYC